PADQDTTPIVTKTDAKGHWSALGLTGGTWNVDISAPGYDDARGSAGVSELQMTPPIKTAMAPSQVQEQAPADAVATASPLIPQTAVDAITQGQDLLKVRAGDVVTSTENTGAGNSTAVSHTVTAEEAKANAVKAVGLFEQAMTEIPTDKQEALDVRSQLQGVMAQAYYRAGNLPKAISTLEEMVAADTAGTDPGTAARKMLLVNLY